MCDRSQLNAATKPTARSRVSNGSDLLPGIDGRSPAARRYRDILDSLLAQLDRAPTEADMILARRAAGLSVRCEIEEAKRIRGEPAEDTATAANALRRLLSDLGLSARAKHRPRIKTNPRPPVAFHGAAA